MRDNPITWLIINLKMCTDDFDMCSVAAHWKNNNYLPSERESNHSFST